MVAPEAVLNGFSGCSKVASCPVRAWDVSMRAVAVFVKFTVRIVFGTQMLVNIDL